MRRPVNRNPLRAPGKSARERANEFLIDEKCAMFHMDTYAYEKRKRDRNKRYLHGGRILTQVVYRNSGRFDPTLVNCGLDGRI